MELVDTLRVRPADNVACKGNLREVFRGHEERQTLLGVERNQTHHILVPGKISGNHWHEKKVELFYVICGPGVDVYLMDRLTGEMVVKRVQESYKFTLAPGIAHALHNPSSEPTHVMEYTNLKFNPNTPRHDVYMLERCLVTGNTLA